MYLPKFYFNYALFILIKLKRSIFILIFVWSIFSIAASNLNTELEIHILKVVDKFQQKYSDEVFVQIDFKMEHRTCEGYLLATL